jgi:hypothetical protein
MMRYSLPGTVTLTGRRGVTGETEAGIQLQHLAAGGDA